MSNFIAQSDGSNLAHRHRVFHSVEEFNNYMGVNGEIAFLMCQGQMILGFFNGVCKGGLARVRMTSGDIPLENLWSPNMVVNGITGGSLVGPGDGAGAQNYPTVAFFRTDMENTDIGATTDEGTTLVVYESIRDDHGILRESGDDPYSTLDFANLPDGTYRVTSTPFGYLQSRNGGDTFEYLPTSSDYFVVVENGAVTSGPATHQTPVTTSGSGSDPFPPIEELGALSVIVTKIA